MNGTEQRPGDWHVVCALSGFKSWASECVMRWDGLYVQRRFIGSEAQRHPQETPYTFPRGEGAVPWSQPEATFTYRSNTAVTAADL